MRFIAATVLLLIGAGSAAPALAERRLWGMAGCGLGSLVFDPVDMQVSAATTNGTGSQSFGLSSGTSNCQNPRSVAMIKDQEDFFAANLASLAKDAARGGGDTIDAVTQVFGCDDAAAVGQKLKSAYTRIFAAPGAMAAYDETVDVLKEDRRMSVLCTNLI